MSDETVLPNSADQANLFRVSRTPDLLTLQREYERAGGGVSYWARENENRRLMLWPGQTSDGRKHREALNDDPFPWEGASDTRIPLVDGTINKLMRVCLAGLMRGELRCEPTELSDIDLAGELEKLGNFYKRILRRELRREGELMGQWGFCDGYSVWHLGWNREWAYETKTLRLSELAGLVQQRPELQPLLDQMMQPALDGDTVQMVLRLIPDLMTTRKAQMFLNRLRNEGLAEWKAPYLVKNQPCITARRVGYDIFFPPETTELDRASVVYILEWLTEGELRQKSVSDGWNEEFITAALKTKGMRSSWSLLGDPVEQTKELSSGYGTTSVNDERIEILYAYTKPVDEDDIPCVYLTVFSPHVNRTARNEQLWGLHEQADYAFGSYPLVPFTRERLSRRVTGSRGVPEVSHTWQREAKVQRDMLADRASIEINPAIRVPNRMGQQYRIGPGSQVKGRPGEVESIEPIKGSPQLAFELLKVVTVQNADYFGLVHPDVLPVSWQSEQQAVVENFLSSAEEMWSMLLAMVLNPELLSPEERERITGVPLAGDVAKPSIMRKFDFQVAFDVRDMDLDWIEKKLAAIAKLVVPLDRGGTIDFSKLVTTIMRSIDPQIARDLLADKAGASEKLFKGVEDDVAKMRLGNQRPPVENDPTAPQKLQFAQGIIGANPEYQSALSDKDGRFYKLMENYVKNLEQSIAQQENKQIGRTGVKPVQ
tara:strand:+ start:376 stop:2514 length:2139 start_codon:yes stop_codon:yes gene_type:complete